MKKLIPLLIIAAGAVAYSVYKNKKEAPVEEEEKTLVVIDDTPTDDGQPEEPENPLKDVEEAAQEVQEELGTFETLTDSDEPFERPSFFHLTEDSYLEPENSFSVEELVSEADDEAITEEKTVGAIDESEEMVIDEPNTEELTVAAEEASEIALEESADVDEPAIYIEETEEAAEVPVIEEGELAVEDSAEEIVEDITELALPDAEDVLEEIAQKVEQTVEEKPAGSEISVEEEDAQETVLEPLPSYNTPELDELMKTIAGHIKAADGADPVEEMEPLEKEPQVEESEVELPEETDYLQDIRKITELYSEKVAQYNIRYPYLSSRFIDDTLKFSEQFNTEYPQGTRVAIEHHAHFTAVEDLFVFAQIIRQTGYSVREGAEDKTLVVTREMYVDTNTILHDVFKVANQVFCLSGEYQKFRITKR